MKLTDSRKSRIALFLAGILAGVLCRLSDFCPYESLWSFSSVATLFGFWIASISVITMHSFSHRGAFLNTFLYLFGMTISFYGLKYLLGFWVPCFDNGGIFLTKLFLLYSALSLLCGIGCSVLYCWNDRRWYSSVLLALPAGALLAEGIACGIVLFACRMLLAQTIFDLGFAAWFAIVLGKKAERKSVFAMSLATSTLLLFFTVYWSASI